MAGNTIMTAKNTFGDGLLMDFAPDNTQATCLTHALNATLLTMNGNELSLQNDMGNGRVETAYLPEGYIPVGTCEFGDIIYIVSYNPITNKSQIGCFPSPERNISSKELSGIETTFNLEDFTKSTGFGFRETISNSVKKVIYDNSLNPGDKFIVHSGNIANNMSRISDYGNKSHIVGAFPKQFKINVVAIEDSGKINYLNSDLKWYDDFFINTTTSNETGKPDIDTYRNILSSGYSVFQSKVSGKLAILIELERIQTFNSTYEVLKSEEVIQNKEITQTTDATDQETPTVNYQSYDIYINFNWKTNNLDVNPKSIVIYDFKWVSNSGDNNKGGQYYVNGEKKGKADPPEFTKIDETGKIKKYIELKITGQANTNSYADFLGSNYQKESDRYKGHTKITQQVENGIPIEGKYYLDLHHIVDGVYYNNKGEQLEETAEVKDCIVNNYFKSSITKKGFTINIPDTYGSNKIDKRDLILSFKVAPMMEYGVLSDLVQTHYIDFSKIGSGEINLEGYKYYIGENLCTLQIDSSIYPEDNKGVAEIEIQFYDNQGLCAKYFINNLVSYSGIITEYIPLNGNSSNYKLSKQDGKKLIPHAGQIFTDDEIPENVDTTLSYVYLNTDITEDQKLEPVEVTYDKDENKFYKGDGENKQEVNISYTSPVFYNDAGILYSNMLYAVKIIYKYTSKNVLGEYNTDGTKWDNVEWRWLWTNTMFNQYYYNVKDFKDNQFELQLDLNVDYMADYTPNIVKQYQNSTKSTEISQSNLGANIQNLNGKINYKINLGLQNSWNTFSLYGDIDKGVYKEGVLNVKVYKGNSSIIYSNLPSSFDYEYLKPINNRTLNESYPDYSQLLKSNTIGDSKDLWNNYKLFTDIFNINLDDESGEEELDYIDYNQNLITSNLSYYSLTGNTIASKKSLSLDLWNFSKYLNIYKEDWQQVNIVSPLLTPDNASELGFTYDRINKNFIIDNIYTLCVTRDTGYAPNGKKDGTGDKIQVIIQWKNLNSVDSNLYVYSFGSDSYHNMDQKRIGVIDYKAVGSGGETSYSQYINGSIRYFGNGSNSVKSDFGESSFKLPLNQFFINTLKISDRWKFSKSNNESNTHQELYNGTSKITSDAVFYQIGYTDINGIHLFNDYSNIGDTNTINQLISCLTQTYKMGDTITKNINALTDIIQYDYTTTYIQNMIYKVTCNTKDIILINNTKLSNYISTLVLGLNNSKLTIKDSNVQAQITSITKNIPIQLDINSIHQELKNQLSSIEFISYNNIQNVQYTQISPNTLYYLDNNNLLISNSQQKVYQLQSVEKQKNSYTAIFGSESYVTPIASVMQLKDDQLICKRTSPTGAAYSIVYTGWGGSGSIRDLQYTDRILSDYQFK